MEFDQQTMSQEYRQYLLEILYQRSFRFDPECGFSLSSGGKSDVYIDAKKTVLSAEGMELTGFAFFTELKLAPVDGIGGLTLGADPIACAAALTSTMNGKPMDVFVVRKEPKKHGTMQWIETNLQPGAWVCVVDDVVTTGASTITAIKRVREAGFQVQCVLCLVDREEGGAENVMKETGLKLYSIFTKSELVEFHHKMEKAKKGPEKPKPVKVERPDF